MNLIISFLLTIIGIARIAAEDGRNGTCCIPPISLFALASDLKDIFPGFTANYFLIQAGEVDDILLLPGIGNQLYLATGLVDFPLVLISTEEGIQYNVTITSDNTQVLLNPDFIPFPSGVISTSPERSHVIFQCVATSTEPIEVHVTVDTYSILNRTQYCPVFFSFGKDCNDETSISSGELEDLSVLDPIMEDVDLPRYGGCNVTTETTPTIIKSNQFPVKVVLSTVLPIITLIIILMSIVLVIWCVWYYRLQQKTKQLELAAIGKAYMDTHELWLSVSHGSHEKEFPTDQLKVTRELGEGAFGIVFEGLANGIEEEGTSTQVAVKQLRDMTAVDEFFREVEFMSHLEHPQIVRLLGVCTQQEPYAMIFEYMDLGDLCSFLRDAALLETEGGDAVLDMLDLYNMALQIAQGMAYIAQRKLVHRDLATRNCLVGTGLIVKIADFGMSRNIYSTDYYRVQGSALLPVRWMAPESIKYGKFSETSDVWSYGILSWEIFTFGQQPYTGYTNDEVIAMIINGGNNLVPPSNSGMMGHVILDCWEMKSKNRPTFVELCSHLGTLIVDIKNKGSGRRESQF